MSIYRSIYLIYLSVFLCSFLCSHTIRQDSRIGRAEGRARRVKGMDALNQRNEPKKCAPRSRPSGTLSHLEKSGRGQIFSG
jgi:hypothetical protein